MNEYLMRSFNSEIKDNGGRRLTRAYSFPNQLRGDFSDILAVGAVGGKAHGFHVATGWTKDLISSIQ
jgi:hypothetical protein